MGGDVNASGVDVPTILNSSKSLSEGKALLRTMLGRSVRVGGT